MVSIYKNMTQYFTDFDDKNDILFCGGSDVESKFSDTTQGNLFEIEDKSWWFPYRARVIERLAHSFLSKEELMFDVGGVMDIHRITYRSRGIMWRS